MKKGLEHLCILPPLSRIPLKTEKEIALYTVWTFRKIVWTFRKLFLLAVPSPWITSAVVLNFFLINKRISESIQQKMGHTCLQTPRSLLQSVNTSLPKVLPGSGSRIQAIYFLVGKNCKNSRNTWLDLTVEWCLKALLGDIKSWRISPSISTLISSCIT